MTTLTTPTPQQQTTNVMLDIETYGTSPGSVIKSIGAVKFHDGKIYAKFYKRVDVTSCIANGLTMDGDTVEWWLQQSDEARKEMALPGEHIALVLEQFTIWISTPDAIVWGNGATFDNTLVAAAYKAVGKPLPWSHRNSLCYRTIKNANRDISIDAYRVRTAHNALDDAESQALHLMAIWERDAKRKEAYELLKQVQGNNLFNTPVPSAVWTSKVMNLLCS